MIGNTRARRCLGAAAVAVLAAVAAPALGATPTSAQEVPTLQVDPTSGTVADTFDAVGTGCADGFIVYRFDDSTSTSDFIPTDVTGEWSESINFPEPVGAHTVTFDCSDPTTVGAPTTFYGPGDVRFSYDPVDLTTLDGAPVTDPIGPCIGGGSGDGSGDGTTGGGTSDPGTGVTSTEITVVDHPPAAAIDTTDTTDTTDTVDTTDSTETTDTADTTETTDPGPVECIADAQPASAEAATATYTG